MSTDLRDLYQEIILKHSHQPKNSGTMDNADGEAMVTTRFAETASVCT